MKLSYTEYIYSKRELTFLQNKSYDNELLCDLEMKSLIYKNKDNSFHQFHIRHRFSIRNKRKCF